MAKEFYVPSFLRFQIGFGDDDQLKEEFIQLVRDERRDLRDMAVILIKEAIAARREQPDRLREEIRKVLREELKHAA